MRRPHSAESEVAEEDGAGNLRSDDNLFMNGGEIFQFTLRAVPQCVEALLSKSGKTMEDVDLFVLHQANQYMLDHLRKRIKSPQEKFQVAMSHCGNTVSCTIPIALKSALDDGKLKAGSLAMLVGFGVGYSWGATLLRWTTKAESLARPST
jgi:3-oxoacyl-[acyl-carrier-protein] synthase-3